MIQVIVVGGGLMGASAAWHLCRAGAGVTLVEQAPGCPGTATASSFGWVGAGASRPSDDPVAFAERLNAAAEFDGVERALGPLPIAARGALVWHAAEAETAAMIAGHRAAGAGVQELSRSGFVAKEPAIARPPPLAAWVPGNFALEPAAFARQLLAAAQAAGARVLRGRVDRVDTAGGRVAGVAVDGRLLSADAVVLANGQGARAVAATAGVELAVHASAAVLLRFGGASCRTRHLVCKDDLELRPSLDGGAVFADDPPDGGEAGLPGLAARAGHAIARLLGAPQAPPLLSARLAMRPMVAGGRALCGRVGNIDGLHALVGHPGVILAPRLGRLCAEAVLDA